MRSITGTKCSCFTTDDCHALAGFYDSDNFGNLGDFNQAALPPRDYVNVWYIGIVKKSRNKESGKNKSDEKTGNSSCLTIQNSVVFYHFSVFSVPNMSPLLIVQNWLRFGFRCGWEWGWGCELKFYLTFTPIPTHLWDVIYSTVMFGPDFRYGTSRWLQTIINHRNSIISVR